MSPDASMTELFRFEAGSAARALSAMLKRSEESGAAPGAEDLEPLVRAAATVRSAARILGLADPGDLARALEDYLTSVLAGEAPLDERRIRYLKACSGVFSKLSTTKDEDMDAALAELADKAAKAQAGLKRAVSRNAPKSGAAAAPEEPKGQKPAKPQADPGMLELFCSEAETHSAALTAKLPSPGDPPPEHPQLEALLIAVHSLDGAARIVNLERAVAMAQAMEETVTRALNEPELLTPDMCGLLGRGAEMFAQLAAKGPAAVAQEEESLAGAMEEVRQGLLAGPTATASEDAGIAAADAVPADEPAHGAKPVVEFEVKAADETQEMPGTVPDMPTATDFGDVSMLELFRAEAAAQAEILRQGIEAEDFRPDSLEPLMRAAHSMKGAARIVNLDQAVTLCQAMEEVLETARQAKSGLAKAQLEPLMRGAAFMADLAAREAKDLSKTLDQNSDLIGEVCAALGKKAPEQAVQLVQKKAPEPAAPAPEPDDTMRTRADVSMLDLFRMEAETHSQTLSQGLVALEAKKDPTQVEPLMRAAHSLKGAARIVNLDAVVGLAHDMEDVLETARQGKAELTSEQIDVLLAATDIFADVARTPAEEVEALLESRKQDIAKLRADLGGAPLPTDLATPVHAGTPASVQAGAPAPPQAAAPAPEPTVTKSPAADPSMLDLFRIEAETNSQVLSEGLVVLEAEGGAERIEPLMRAAHSMKGAARIVNLDLAVTLAHDMEDLLEAARQGKLTLSPEQIDLLLAATDVFTDLSSLDPTQIEARLENRRQEIHELCGKLTGKPVAPAPPPPQVAKTPMPEERRPEPLVAVPVVAEPDAAPADQAKPRPAVKADGRTEFRRADSIVRVSAEHLSRLMGMAGESLVQAKRLAPFTTQLMSLKDQLASLGRALELLSESLSITDEAQGAFQYMNEALDKAAVCRHGLAESMETLENINRRSENITSRLYNEVIRSRMRPFADAVRGFPRLVRDVARELGKKVKLEITGESTEVDRDILEKLEAPLNHILRNSVDHGIESPEERQAQGKDPVGRVYLKAVHRAGMLWITAGDDGRGLDKERIRTRVIERKLAPEKMAQSMSDTELMDFLFLPGFTTTDQVTRISGRGVGLDVVQSMVQEVGGSVMAESSQGKGIQFTLTLPLTLSVLRTLLADIRGEPYAFPLTRVDRIAVVPMDKIETVEERQYAVLDGDRVGIVPASEVLGLGSHGQIKDEIKVIVLSDRLNRYGLVVDDFLGERDLAVQPLDSRLDKVSDLAATALMEDGAPVLIMDVEDLVRSMDNLLTGGRLGKVGLIGEELTRVKRVLVVDDSLTVREVERKLLENNGYLVEVAVDGMDGLNAALSGRYDLIITDVDMPRMTGIELVRKVRSAPEISATPIMIVSYKDREEERHQGLDAGANYYLTKSSFHDETLLEAVRDLIGGARE